LRLLLGVELVLVLVGSDVIRIKLSHTGNRKPRRKAKIGDLRGHTHDGNFMASH
jgi:hypothetical protein